MEDVRQLVDRIVVKHWGGTGGLIPVLQELQGELGYLPKPALERVAQRLKVPLSRVYGVVTFYSQFSLSPRGQHMVQVCLGTACHVRGGKQILDALSSELNLRPGETTKGGEFSLEIVRCVGCCSLAPVMVVNGVAYGRLTPTRAIRILGERHEGQGSGRT